MRVTVVGAGAVGLNLAGRLAARGATIQLVTRRSRAAEAIARRGISLEDPATGETVHAEVAVALGIERAEGLEGGPVMICVRASDTAEVADRLHAAAPRAVPVSAQNDVDNETLLARRFDRVLGLVVRQTCTLRDARTVLSTGRGRLVIGRHPEGACSVAEALAHRLEAAGFDVGRSSTLSNDKWLKLLHNLMSSVNALVRRPDHTRPAFVELKIRLLEEGRQALAAADIEASSCDGRDRSVEEEIAHLRRSLAEGTSARALPLFNACWAALSDPVRPLEADVYHRRILDLAMAHAMDAPTNAALLEAVTDAWATRTGPEQWRADDLLERARRREHTG